jgi:hypothetical protein
MFARRISYFFTIRELKILPMITFDGASDVGRQFPSPHEKRLAFRLAMRSNLLFNLQKITAMI